MNEQKDHGETAALVPAGNVTAPDSQGEQGAKSKAQATKALTLKGLTQLLRYKTENKIFVVNGVSKTVEDHVTDRITEGAAAGDKAFIELLLDRLEGKPRQTLHVTDDEYVVKPAPPPESVPVDVEVIPDAKAD